MIKAKKQTAKVSGNIAEVFAELVMVIRGVKEALLESGVPAEQVDVMLSDAYKIGTMGKKESTAYMMEAIAKRLKEEEENE